MSLFDDDDTRTEEGRAYTRRIALFFQGRHGKVGSGVNTFLRGLTSVVDEDTLVEVVWIGEPGHIEKSFINTVYDLARTAERSSEIQADYNVVARYQNAIEDMVNSDKMYDLFVFNDVEGALAFSSQGTFSRYMPSIYITHTPTLWNGKYTGYTDFYRFLSNVAIFSSDIPVVTQTPENRKYIQEVGGHSAHMVLPLIGADLEPEREERELGEGILFIGRFERRKWSKEAIDFAKMTGQKIKVLVGGHKITIQKWLTAFKKFGITNYEIGSNLIGQEKIDFIKSSRAAIITSPNETYGYNMLESLWYLPTIVRSADWSQYWKPHPNAHFVKSLEEGAKLLPALGTTFIRPETLDEQQRAAKQSWGHILNKFDFDEEYRTKTDSQYAKRFSVAMSRHEMVRLNNLASFTGTDYRSCKNNCVMVHYKDKTILENKNA